MLMAASYLPMLLFAGLALIGMAGTILWLFALIDCLKNEPSEGNDKIIWLLVILLGHGFGALIYLLVRRPQRLS